MTRVFTPQVQVSIARCRLILSVVALIAVIVDPTVPFVRRWLPVHGTWLNVEVYALVTLVLHLLYSILAHVAASRRWFDGDRFATVTTGMDVAFSAIIACFTEGTTSPFYAFFVFAVVEVGFWAGFRPAIMITAVSVALYLSLILVSERGLVNLYITRPVYLAIVGYLVAYLGQQRLNLEAEMKEARSDAESIVETVPDPLLVLNAELRIETANRAFYETFQSEPAEGKRLSELQDGCWNVPGLHERLKEVIPQTGGFSEVPVEQDFPGVGHKSLLLHARRLERTDSSRQLILLAIEDITERQRLERQKADFFATLTHDIKGPLQVILGATDILVEEANDRGAEEQRSMLQRLQQGSQNLHALVSNYLDGARYESGALTLDTRPEPLNPFLSRVVEQHRSEARRKGVALDVSLHPSEPIVMMDAPALQRVFANLINNAIKFTPAGGRITIHCEITGDHAVIGVTDTGAGISADELPFIFDRYRRTRSSAGHEGTGLGLFIVKALVEAHGGHVEVRSRPGSGSCFSVSLPLARVASAEMDRSAHNA